MPPGDRRSWVLLVTVGELHRDIGLGGVPGVTLARAREKARDMIERGIDPIEERKGAKSALIASQRRGLRFADTTD